MKNIIKSLVVFASVIGFSSANAGELTVTGTAKANYNIQSSDSTTDGNNAGKNIGIANELAFTGTGELDNGFTWKYQVELDDNSSGNTTSDDTRLELTTPYGTVAAYNTEGSLNTKYKFSQAAYGAGTDNGASGSMNYGSSIDSYNNLQFHSPAGLLPFDMIAKVAYAPHAETSKVSSNAAGTVKTSTTVEQATQYQLIGSPVEGATLGASYIMEDGEVGTIQGYESGGIFGTYKVGAFSLGAGLQRTANNISDVTSQATTVRLNTAALKAATKHFENQAYSIGYAVNDSLSISYENEESTAEKRVVAELTAADTDSSVELQVQTVQAAYTMGGMTLSLSHKQMDNVDYAVDINTKETLFVVAMAF